MKKSRFIAMLLAVATLFGIMAPAVSADYWDEIDDYKPYVVYMNREYQASEIATHRNNVGQLTEQKAGTTPAEYVNRCKNGRPVYNMQSIGFDMDRYSHSFFGTEFWTDHDPDWILDPFYEADYAVQATECHEGIHRYMCGVTGDREFGDAGSVGLTDIITWSGDWTEWTLNEYIDVNGNGHYGVYTDGEEFFSDSLCVDYIVVVEPRLGTDAHDAWEEKWGKYEVSEMYAGLATEYADGARSWGEKKKMNDAMPVGHDFYERTAEDVTGDVLAAIEMETYFNEHLTWSGYDGAYPTGQLFDTEYVKAYCQMNKVIGRPACHKLSVFDMIGKSADFYSEVQLPGAKVYAYYEQGLRLLVDAGHDWQIDGDFEYVIDDYGYICKEGDWVCADCGATWTGVISTGWLEGNVEPNVYQFADFDYDEQSVLDHDHEWEWFDTGDGEYSQQICTVCGKLGRRIQNIYIDYSSGNNAYRESTDETPDHDWYYDADQDCVVCATCGETRALADAAIDDHGVLYIIDEADADVNFDYVATEESIERLRELLQEGILACDHENATALNTETIDTGDAWRMDTIYGCPDCRLMYTESVSQSKHRGDDLDEPDPEPEPLRKEDDEPDDGKTEETSGGCWTVEQNEDGKWMINRFDENGEWVDGFVTDDAEKAEAYKAMTDSCNLDIENVIVAGEDWDTDGEDPENQEQTTFTDPL